ncbi:MAG: hypothetical protein JWN45_1345 [Acidobacteriaceae bacterium]|nr:hypothetical protein [Acidobacteriaceae bacterium]
MIDLLMADAKIAPQAFEWNGSLKREEVEDWVCKKQLTLPQDLIDLWVFTGGGVVFESEQILAPWQVHSFAKSLENVNTEHLLRGKPSRLLIFEEGSFLSAIDLLTQKIVTIDENYKQESSFSDLNSWYRQTLRHEFGERYSVT